MFKTIIEPFRIKSVEPIHLLTSSERQEKLKTAHYNLFTLHADDVLIDLLTDSGTAAMSAAQWAAIQLGDESYAGSPSFYRFEAAVKTLMPFKHVIPTHQGRAAEKILASLFGGAGRIILNNTHFDTTRANVESSGAQAIDLITPEGLEINSLHPFKGNMDLAQLEKVLSTQGDAVSLVMITLTNNASGGQPVSMENIRETARLCKQFGKPFFIDGCRFAENAYFIKTREPGFSTRSITSIVQEIFSYADGMTMSAKKDGLANMGGWLALNDDEWATQSRNLLILTEGFPTYGGMSGRDLEAIAVGLREVVDEDYLKYRIRSAAYLGEGLQRLGVPVIQPIGGHAVFIDARAFLPHIPALQYPGQALTTALYELGGIRSVEIGSVMFGLQPDGREVPARMELVRLALPRRVYTQSHVDYVIECFEKLREYKDQLPGFKITWQPKALRHFTAQFAPIA